MNRRTFIKCLSGTIATTAMPASFAESALADINASVPSQSAFSYLVQKIVEAKNLDDQKYNFGRFTDLAAKVTDVPDHFQLWKLFKGKCEVDEITNLRSYVVYSLRRMLRDHHINLTQFKDEWALFFQNYGKETLVPFSDYREIDNTIYRINNNQFEMYNGKNFEPFSFNKNINVREKQYNYDLYFAYKGKYATVDHLSHVFQYGNSNLRITATAKDTILNAFDITENEFPDGFFTRVQIDCKEIEMSYTDQNKKVHHNYYYSVNPKIDNRLDAPYSLPLYFSTVQDGADLNTDGITFHLPGDNLVGFVEHVAKTHKSDFDEILNDRFYGTPEEFTNSNEYKLITWALNHKLPCVQNVFN